MPRTACPTSNGMAAHIANTARHVIPKLPLSKIAHHILGDSYELSVVFVLPKEMEKLNTQYRKKKGSTDILAFPLSGESGEIFFSMPDVIKKAPLFNTTTRCYLAYLFIHGCLHLKGHTHGRTMDRLEHKFCKAFELHYPG